MAGFIFTSVLMFVFWFSLSGELNPILLGLGVISSLLVAWWSRDLLIGSSGKLPDLGIFLRVVAYLPWLLWQTALSNLQLFYLILHPKMPLEPSIVRYKHDLRTDFGIVTLANSITLTPGTLTMDGNREEYIIHCITKSAAEDLQSDEMLKKVKWVEGSLKERSEGTVKEL